jgi:5-methyltetrahydropteroyltriglutamate--homocysteine methyltransferase
VVETAGVVEQRIRAALQVLKPEQLWVDPDCGLKTRTRDEAVAKLRAMVEATRRVRKEISDG